MANGNALRIAHVKESSWGTPSGTTYNVDRFLGGASIDINRSSFVSQEFRTDRGIANSKLGVKKISAKLPFEFGYGSYDDYIESMMCDAWQDADTPKTNLTATVVAGATNTIEAIDIHTGIYAGDWVKVSGFTGSYENNNGYWKVTAVTTDVLTLGEAKDASGNSMLIDCTNQAGISVTRVGYIKTGTTLKSLTLEEGYTDINVYNNILGCAVDSFDLSMAPDSIVSGNFNLIGKGIDGSSPKNTQYGSSYIPADTNDKIDTYSGFLRVDGQVVGVVTSANLSLQNGLEAMYPIFQTDAYRIGIGRSNLSGSISLYLLDDTYFVKYLNEAPLALSLTLLEADGARGYSIDIPKVSITGLSKNVTENNIVLTIPFQAVVDDASGLVNWRWNRLV